MRETDIWAEALNKLEAIQSKYDIFFKVNQKKITDYFELDLAPQPTLKLKSDSRPPLPMMNDLRKDFHLIER